MSALCSLSPLHASPRSVLWHDETDVLVMHRPPQVSCACVYVSSYGCKTSMKLILAPPPCTSRSIPTPVLTFPRIPSLVALTQFTLKDAVVEGCFIGKHVICPPAMGLDYSEALAMRDAARPHTHALGHTANELRYSRKAMWAREHVASGGLGAVENVEVRVHGAGEMKGSLSTPVCGGREEKVLL